MVAWHYILISILAFFVILIFLFGVRKIILEKELGLNLVSKKINNNRNYTFFNSLASKYKDNRKILLVVLSVVSICGCYLVFGNFIFSLFISVCIVIFILDLLKRIKDSKKDLLHSQLIELINTMIIMLKAGRTVRNILKDSVKWTKNPLKCYLVELVNALELNFTLDEALERFSSNCQSREVKLLASALKINNKIGGDLVFILSRIVDTLQHSLKAKSQIKTMTLQSRYSGSIISFLPILVLIALFIFKKDAVNTFFSSSFGNILLFIGGTLEIIGIMVIKSILNIGGRVGN